MNKDPILEVSDLEVVFSLASSFLFGKKKKVFAVNKVSFQLYEEEILGIVGESGCGKSTLAKAILRILDNNSHIEGKIVYLGENITHLNDKAMRRYARKTMQVILQDPLSSLNPRMTIFDIIAEPLMTHSPELTRAQVVDEVKKIMTMVGLSPAIQNRYPHEFSGGQNQRVGIARAIILRPKLLICDEAVSALDVSVKAQIINLLQDLKKQLKMSVLFVSHDLSIVKYISDRILVLYLGEIMELGVAEEIYHNAKHPYTQALISAVPIPDPRAELQKDTPEIQGDIPSLFVKQQGCPFASRCASVMDLCKEAKPTLTKVDNTLVSCFLYNNNSKSS